jgi:LPXTG-site transpeptidase (sortase) family protein
MDSNSSKFFTHRRFNNALTVLIVLMAFYMIAWPFLPQATWWVKHNVVKSKPPTTQSLVAQNTRSNGPPEQNTLIIPELSLYEQIREGKTIAAANKGVWRLPNTDTPDKGGNTVIVGHRFTYAGLAVFYNLDKLKQADKITIYWDKTPYIYQISSIKVVDPSDISVEAHSMNNMLTLYTCTPLWSTKNRLVIQADFIGNTL